MPITAASIVTELVASTSQFEARMTAAGTAVERFTRPQIIATRAAGQLTASVNALAQEALGSAGPIGRLGTSLLGLAGGTTGLGIAAGVGLIGLAFRKLAKDAEEAEKAIQSAIDRLQRSVDAFARGNQDILGVDLLTRRVAEAQAAEAALRARGVPGVGEVVGLTAGQGPAGFLVGLVAGLTGVSSAQQDAVASMEAAARMTSILTNALNRMTEALGEAERRADALAALAQRQVDAFRAPGAIGVPGVGGVPIAPIPSEIGAQLRERITRDVAIPAGETRAAGLELATPALDAFNRHIAQAHALLVQLETPQRAYERQLALLTFAHQAGEIGTVQYMAAMDQLNARMKQGQSQAMQLGIAIINAFNAALQAIQSGSIGGFIGAVGGIVGTFNPAVGMVIAGVGALATTIESGNDRRFRDGETNAERRNRELVGALSELGEAIIVLNTGFDPSDPRNADRLAAILGQVEQRGIVIVGREQVS